MAIVESMLADRAPVGAAVMQAGRTIGEVEALPARLARAEIPEKLEWLERIQL